MQVQQDILSGLVFDDDITGTEDLKLPVYKHSHLVKTIKDICALIPTEEQKARLLSLYLMNYKVQKDVDFDQLLSFVQEKPYKDFLRKFRNIVQGETQKLSVDKHSRYTPYLTQDEI